MNPAQPQPQSPEGLAASTTATGPAASPSISIPLVQSPGPGPGTGIGPDEDPTTDPAEDPSAEAPIDAASPDVAGQDGDAAGSDRIRRGPESSVAVRAAALALYGEGIKPKDIEKKCGIKRVSFAKLLGRARKRGYIPGRPVQMEHVVDAPRSGRPKKNPTK